MMKGVSFFDFVDEFVRRGGEFIVIDEKFTVEVGGANKSFKQIANILDSFLALDDMEIGFGGKIPLWLFGFLY